MPTTDTGLDKTLSALGISTAEQVAARFGELRGQFDVAALSVHDESSLKPLRDEWLGRKSGVFSLVTDNWLKKSESELKPIVGQELNGLRKYVDGRLEQLQREVSDQAEAAATLKERVDLSLPGVIRPIGTHHLIRQVFQEIEDIFVSIGFSGVGRAGNRAPLLQLRGAEYSRAPSGPRRHGHVLPGVAQERARAFAAAHAYFAGADSHYGKAPAASARDCTRESVPPRQSGRDALVHVPPD